jgi:hypothetical protein
MKAILNFQIMWPIFIWLLQTMLFLFIGATILWKLGMIKRPLAGMEYSQAIMAAVTIFSVLLISTASAGPLFQTFKTMQNQGSPDWRVYGAKAGELLLVSLFFEVLLGLIMGSMTKAFMFLRKSSQQINEGSMPTAIIASALVLGMAIGLRVMTAEVLEYVTPQYINFN